jgi:hypothetical protein
VRTVYPDIENFSRSSSVLQRLLRVQVPATSKIYIFWLYCIESCGTNQGSFFWHQNKEGEPLVGVFATNHQPEVLPLYFGARKKNPGTNAC